MYVQSFLLSFCPVHLDLWIETRERKWTMKLHILWMNLVCFLFSLFVQFNFSLCCWRYCERAEGEDCISPFFSHFWGALFVLIRLCILLLLLFLSDNIQKWLAILFVLLHAYRQSSLSCLKGSRHQDIFFNRKKLE